MTWKQFGCLALVLLLLQVVRHAAGEQWRWLAFAAVLVGVLVAGRISAWRWSDRLDRMRQASPEELEQTLARMTPADRSAVRVALDLVTSDDARADSPDGETFAYPRTPAALREATFWGSVLMSALPLTLLALGKVRPDQVVGAAAVGIGFACSVYVQLSCWDAEWTLVIVTPAGLQELRVDGTRRGILWSEVGTVRNRPWLMAVDVTAADGRRRIRVGYRLERFPRFMELLVANCQRVEERRT